MIGICEQPFASSSPDGSPQAQFGSFLEILSTIPHFLGFVLLFTSLSLSPLFPPGGSFSLSYLVAPFTSTQIFISTSSHHISTLSITILLVAISTQLYSISYIQEPITSHRLPSLTLIFTISIVLLVSSSSFFTLLFRWDLLGISSYFLILHYFSPSSSPSAKITIISNRVGDALIILTLFTLLSLPPNNLGCVISLYPLLFATLISISALTKSSQFPFSCWLPEAIAAPTPISSLVHSSTLVTAGYFLIWLSFYYLSKFLLTSLSLITGFTLLLASLSALFLSDLKKLVAFSTLSQVSLIILTLSLQASTLSLFHIITHALFKSTLFILVGTLLHIRWGAQDSRYLPSYSIPSWVQPLYILPLTNLLGLIFTSGFLSKELVVLSTLSTSPSTIHQI